VADVGVHEAKTNLSHLLRRVAEGEEIVIRRGREPVARLVPMGPPLRRTGQLRGILTVPEDFDSPLPESVLEEFER